MAVAETEFTNIIDVLSKLSKVNSMTLNALNVHNMDRATRKRISETLLLHEKIDPSTENNGKIWQQYVTYHTPVADIGSWPINPARWTPHGGNVTFKYTIPDSDCMIDSLELTRPSTFNTQFKSLDHTLKLNFKNRDTRYGNWSVVLYNLGLDISTKNYGDDEEHKSIDQPSYTLDITGTIIPTSNWAQNSIGTLPFLLRSTFEKEDIIVRVQDNNSAGTDPCLYVFRIHCKYSVSNTITEKSTNNSANVEYYTIKGIKSFYSDNILTTKYKGGQESTFFLTPHVTGPGNYD